ncbi:MAG TPA: hypothetical protein DHV62_02175, partial [Elusimicrobia bacterium]|nr:hypothetical protein [Elusimicrobiota bacterium]
MKFEKMLKLTKIVFWLNMLFICCSICFGEDFPPQFVPLYQTDGKTIWLPNTTAINGAAAVEFEGRWYLPLTSGLGEFNPSDNGLLVYRLPKSESGISSLAKIENKLWVGTWRDGIKIFDLTSKQFVDDFKVSQSTEFGANENLKFVYDQKTETIWISSFHRIDIYDTKIGLWENLNHIYTKLGIDEPPGNNYAVIETTFVWIVPFAERRSKGVLLCYNKISGEWKTYHHDELMGDQSPYATIDCFVVSPKYAWVLVGFQNYYDTRIAEYDKNNGKWKIFRLIQTEETIDRLLNDISMIKSYPRFDLARFLRGCQDGYKRYHQDSDLKKYFEDYSEEKMEKIVNKLSKIPQLDMMEKIPYFGMHKNFVLRNKIFSLDEQRWIMEIAQ